MKLNQTHQLLLYADYVNSVGEGMNTTTKNMKALLDMHKEVGLKVNAQKTNYTFLIYELNTEWNHNIKVPNKSFETVTKLKYLGITLKNQNWVHDDIKGSLNLGNICHNLVHNLMSSSFLSKNINIKIKCASLKGVG